MGWGGLGMFEEGRWKEEVGGGQKDCYRILLGEVEIGRYMMEMLLVISFSCTYPSMY